MSIVDKLLLTNLVLFIHFFLVCMLLHGKEEPAAKKRFKVWIHFLAVSLIAWPSLLIAKIWF